MRTKSGRNLGECRRNPATLTFPLFACFGLLFAGRLGWQLRYVQEGIRKRNVPNLTSDPDFGGIYSIEQVIFFDRLFCAIWSSRRLILRNIWKLVDGVSCSAQVKKETKHYKYRTDLLFYTIVFFICYVSNKIFFKPQ